MNITFELVKKAWKKDDGSTVEYYVLRYTLVDSSVIEIPVKSDKARLLILSYNLSKK